ncbi:hypothetical protein Hanom_Chr08g00719451 [Helianthus anomalus]
MNPKEKMKISNSKITPDPRISKQTSSHWKVWDSSPCPSSCRRPKPSTPCSAAAPSMSPSSVARRPSRASPTHTHLYIHTYMYIKGFIPTP